MLLPDICANDAYGMLIRRIRRLPRHHRPIKLELLFCRLHILIIDRLHWCFTLLNMHSLSHRHNFHLISDPPLILHLLNFQLLFLNIFLPLFLIDLLL